MNSIVIITPSVTDDTGGFVLVVDNPESDEVLLIIQKESKHDDRQLELSTGNYRPARRPLRSILDERAVVVRSCTGDGQGGV